MRPSLRFLGARGGRLGRRFAPPTLGMLPGAEMFQIERGEAKAPPPIVPTEFPPIEPVAPAAADRAASADLAQAAMPRRRHGPADPRPVYYRVPRPGATSPGDAPLRRAAPDRLSRRRNSTAPIPPLDEWPLSRIAVGVDAGAPLDRRSRPAQSTAGRASPSRASTACS